MLRPDQSSSAPLLSLEDRTAVAISARGARRIGEFILNAVADSREDVTFQTVARVLYFLSDEEFVGALEAEVFGDDESLPAQSAGSVRGPRLAPSSESEHAE